MSVALRAVVSKGASQAERPNSVLGRGGRVRLQRVRLLLGCLLIAASAIGGNALFSDASEHVSLYVLAKDLAAGSVVTPSDLEVKTFSGSSSSLYASADADIIGQRIRRDLYAGEFIPMNALSTPSDLDLRIVSIPLSAGHSPLVESGQLVDVWMTPALDSVDQPGPAQLVLPNVAVEGGIADADPTLDSVVTLAVPFDDVQLVVEAMQKGAISLVAVQGNRRSTDVGVQ